MRPAFPASDYYEASAPPGAISRRRACPSAALAARQWGRHRTVPTFISNRSTSEASSSTPTASPRLHRRSSPWPPGRLSHRDQKFSNPAPRSRVRTATSPYPPDLSWWAVKGRQTLISRVHLLVLLTGPASSGSADTSRRCQGCSHPHQRPLDQAAPSFHPAAATTRQRRSLTSIRLQTPRGARGFRPNRSRRTLSRNAPLSSLSVIEPSWSMRRT